jgi:hypothetical protein
VTPERSFKHQIDKSCLGSGAEFRREGIPGGYAAGVGRLLCLRLSAVPTSLDVLAEADEILDELVRGRASTRRRATAVKAAAPTLAPLRVRAGGALLISWSRADRPIIYPLTMEAARPRLLVKGTAARMHAVGRSVTA